MYRINTPQPCGDLSLSTTSYYQPPTDTQPSTPTCSPRTRSHLLHRGHKLLSPRVNLPLWRLRNRQSHHLLQAVQHPSLRFPVVQLKPHHPGPHNRRQQGAVIRAAAWTRCGGREPMGGWGGGGRHGIGGHGMEWVAWDREWSLRRGGMGLGCNPCFESLALLLLQNENCYVLEISRATTPPYGGPLQQKISPGKKTCQLM